MSRSSHYVFVSSFQVSGTVSTLLLSIFVGFGISNSRTGWVRSLTARVTRITAWGFQPVRFVCIWVFPSRYKGVSFQSVRPAFVFCHRMSEPVIDPAEYEQLKAEVVYLRRTADKQQTLIETLTSTVMQLSASVTALQRQAAGATGGPDIALPERWNGVEGRPDGLLVTLEMIFECYPARYGTACSKVALLTSCLSGRAQEWAAALYQAKSATCNDYTLFVEELLKTFVPSSSEIKQKLMDHGMAENITVKWRKQPDGKVFHKEKENDTTVKIEL